MRWRGPGPTAQFRRMWAVHLLYLLAAVGVLIAHALGAWDRRGRSGAVRFFAAGPDTPTAIRIADTSGAVVVPWSPPPIDAPIHLPAGHTGSTRPAPDI